MNTDRSTATLSPPAETTRPAPATCPANDPAPLPQDVPALHALIRELLDTIKKERHEREGLQQRLDLLLRRLYGPKAERFDPNQPWLIAEMAPNAAGSAVDTPLSVESPTNDVNDADKPKRQGHGRKPLPKDLPRVRHEHVLPEAERLCPCCGVVCQKFGEDVSEQLDYKPASLFVHQHVRCKYACQKCHDHVTAAPLPIAIIDKGLPGPGLLAFIAASKYADHLPLHRLERIIGRHGVDIARSTTCDWMAYVAGMLRPVVDIMASLVRQSKAIHTDATKMPFLDPNVPGKSLSGQIWTYVGDRDHAFNVFDFCRDHSAAGIDAFLKSHHYRGFLNADAHNLYDHLFQDGSILETGCWAHCRRHFHDAKGNDPARSHVVMARIRQLYSFEAEAREIIAEQELLGADADAIRYRLRQEKSLFEVTALRQWLEAERPKVLPKSLIGLAIAYALRHWTALTRFLGDGFLAIDNNLAELTLRHVAIGRKNWLFGGSVKGAQTAATLFSVTSSCHRHKIDVFAYLHDLLERLAHDPKPNPQVLRDWLPDRWKPPPKSPTET